MSVVDLSRQLARAAQGAEFEDREKLRQWFYEDREDVETLEEAPEWVRELVEELSNTKPLGLSVDGKVLSDSILMLVASDGFSDPQTVESVNITDNNVSVAYPDGTTESIEAASDSIIKYESGLVRFVDKDKGADYVLRPIDESDGYWLSSYRIALPVEALAGLVSQTNEGSTVNYLENEGEEMVAFQSSEEDNDIVAIYYTNRLGRWTRSSGEWFLAAHDDDSTDDTRAYEVNKNTVQEFLQVFDNGPVSAGDIKKYLSPIKD